MTRKDIIKLVAASYTKDVLDSKKTEKIAGLLSRNDLKQYIRGLKIAEKSRTISLVLPDRNLYNKSLLGATKKHIKVVEDKSLLAGLKVIDNDIVYDYSLKNNLNEFIESI